MRRADSSVGTGLLGRMLGLFSRRHRFSSEGIEEFSELRSERVGMDDAVGAGLSRSWYEEFVQRHFGGQEPLAEQFGFALEDPTVRALLRYKLECRRLVERMGPLLDSRLDPYDAIAADVAGPGLAAVVREIAPEQNEVSIKSLIPEITRPAVRDLLLGSDGEPSPLRVRRALSFVEPRQAREREYEAYLDKTASIDLAIEAGAASDALRSLAQLWFAEGESLSVAQLVRATQVADFRKLLGWITMMAGGPSASEGQSDTAA